MKIGAADCEDTQFNGTIEKIFDECLCLVVYSHASNEHVDIIRAKFDLNYKLEDIVVAFLTCAQHQSAEDNFNLTVTANYEGHGYVDWQILN